MSTGFSHCLQIFPTSDIKRTSQFYEEIGFRAVNYLDAEEPHVCLYRIPLKLY